jgi:hypothetical protein
MRRWASVSGRSKDCDADILRGEAVRRAAALLGLEDEGTTIIGNFEKHSANDRV